MDPQFIEQAQRGLSQIEQLLTTATSTTWQNFQAAAQIIRDVRAVCNFAAHAAETPGPTFEESVETGK